jgi:hypothetical protein
MKFQTEACHDDTNMDGCTRSGGAGRGVVKHVIIQAYLSNFESFFFDIGPRSVNQSDLKTSRAV